MHNDNHCLLEIWAPDSGLMFYQLQEDYDKTGSRETCYLVRRHAALMMLSDYS